MTQNQKIAIGLGALAIGYWLYTKNKASKSAETPATPSNDSDCPEGQVLSVVNCKVAPCPKVCVDKPKTNPLEPIHEKPKDPIKISSNSKGTIYTCKDGSTETRYADKIYAGVPPCMKQGGYTSYMPIENMPQKGWCPTGFKYNSMIGCIPINKPNGMVY